VATKAKTYRPQVLLVNINQLEQQLLFDYLSAHDLVVTAASSFAQASEILKTKPIDLVITDLILEERKISKAEFLSFINGNSNTGTVIFTSVPDPRLLGIELNQIPRHAAYIVSDQESSLSNLLEACRFVLSGRVPTKHRHHLLAKHALAELSRSQLNVLSLVAAGASNTEIAKQRGTTVRAVENLMKRTLSAMKLDGSPDSNSRVKAVLIYLETMGIKTPTRLDSNR
jgi:DNA-binding NarL/FixJ family response regulator